MRLRSGNRIRNPANAAARDRFRNCLTIADLACWRYSGRPDMAFAAKLEGRD
jgi:hypothetical protein